MTVVVKAARIFDGKSDALIRNSCVVVEGDRIAGIVSTTRQPAGADVIDLGDVTLSPGFIDAHTHLTWDYAASYDKDLVDRFRLLIPELAYRAAANAAKTLQAGFTTVRDVGSLHFLDVGLRNAINQGLVSGPRMLASVRSIAVTGGHADFTAGIRPGLVSNDEFINAVSDGPEGMRKAVRFNVKYGADVIKFCASGGVMSPVDEVDTPQMTSAEMTALVDEAHRLRKKVAVHCHGDQAAKEAIQAGVDSIEHGSFLEDDTLELMKAKGVYLVPTLFAGEWVASGRMQLPPEVEAKALAAKASHSKSFRRAVKIGVKIGYGTDSSVYPHGMNAKEFAMMAGLGMSPIAVLASATSVNAALLGIADQIGTLEEGKYADLVAMPGDAVAVISATERVSFVMKNGVVVKRDSRSSL
jgi:imidazolonepropionase-like amidohydrolase